MVSGLLGILDPEAGLLANMNGVALEPGKAVVVCPDCDKEIIISAEAERYTCPLCLEVFTAPERLERSLRRTGPSPFGRILVTVGLLVLLASISARLGLLGSDAYHSILQAGVIPGSLMIFFGRGMLRDSSGS